jgi:hypothetical protein
VESDDEADQLMAQNNQANGELGIEEPLASLGVSVNEKVRRLPAVSIFLFICS